MPRLLFENYKEDPEVGRAATGLSQPLCTCRRDISQSNDLDRTIELANETKFLV